MVNINSLERDGLRQAELCPRHTMKILLKLGGMHRQTGEKFVDPTAMSRQMREVSDF